MSSTKKNSPKKPASKKKAKVVNRNADETRAKLLQATVDLLAEKGPDGLSLKEAARLANVSRTITYRYFGDREQLLREAKAWVTERILEAAIDIQPSLTERSVGEVMKDNVEYATKIILDNREAAQMLIADAITGRMDIHHPLNKMTMRNLEALEESGYARSDFDKEALAAIMLGEIASILIFSFLVGGDDPDTVAQRYNHQWISLLREGLIRKTPAKSSKSLKQSQQAVKGSTAAVKKLTKKTKNI